MTEEKKRYFFTQEILKVQGWQRFSVLADDKEQAKLLAERGEGEFEDEEIGVIHLSDPVLEKAE